MSILTYKIMALKIWVWHKWRSVWSMVPVPTPHHEFYWNSWTIPKNTNFCSSHIWFIFSLIVLTPMISYMSDIDILLKNMRLSNFTSLSVLSFADKPKLAYLIRPTKKGEKRANCLQKSTQIQIWHLKAKWTLKVSLYVANPSISQPFE